MIYIETDITKELPPNIKGLYFIVRYNGEGSTYDGEVGEHTGEELNDSWSKLVKFWLKPIDEKEFLESLKKFNNSLALVDGKNKLPDTLKIQWNELFLKSFSIF